MRLDPVLAHNLLLQGELLRVARALDARGIDFVPLKGVTLLQRVYGRLDARPVSDNDLLFRKAELPRALEALRELGYEPRIQADLDDALTWDARYVLERRHHGRALWIDAHTSPFVPTMHVAEEDWFWSHTEPFRIDDVTLRVFTPEVTLLHLVAHAEQHHFCVPRILRDVAAAWNRWSTSAADTKPALDPARLLGLAAKAGLEHVLDYVLGALAALGWLDTPPPYIGSPRARRLRPLLPPERLARATHPQGPEAYWRAACAFLLRDPDRVLAQVRKDLFPPLSKLTVIHDRPASPLLYLHYATRPFRPLARALGWRPPPPASSRPQPASEPSPEAHTRPAPNPERT